MTASYAVYCVIDLDREVPESSAGLQAGTVCCLPYRGIGVAVSLLAQPIRDIVAGAVEHETVVEHLMQAHTVLPMRFPTIFPSREAVLAMMSQHYDSFRESLHRLRNQVEFGIRVIRSVTRSPSAEEEPPLRASVPQESSGQLYMRERYRRYRHSQALQQQAAAVQRRLDAALREFVTAKRLRTPATDSFAFDGVYLVDKDRGADFRRAFVTARGSESGFRYLFSGPWPPYSFVTI